MKAKEKTEIEMMTKPKLRALIQSYWLIVDELGVEVPSRICTKMVELHGELEDWHDDLHPQVSWPKNHGNQAETK